VDPRKLWFEKELDAIAAYAQGQDQNAWQSRPFSPGWL
jgi:hypothetical protein